MTTTVRDTDLVDAREPLAPQPAAAASGKPKRERLLALDVFRGATVAGMLLVNNPGTWGAIYPPLEHAEWNGWTPTDLIFPFFLFIAGVTTHLSLAARRARGDDDRALRRQIIRRGLLIFLIGFMVNGFPYFSWGEISGVADPSFMQRVVDRLYHWRIMGVLQRIGLAYMCAGLLSYGRTVKQQVATIAVLLYGYWFAMTLLPVPDTGVLGQLALDKPAGTLAAWADRLLLDWSRFGLGNHIWVGGVTWDPEGLLSTIPAIGSAMLGNLLGQWLSQKRSLGDRLNGMFTAGALGMMVGLMWNWAFPINKGIWTSSYVLFCAGMATIAIATIMWLVDVQNLKGWTKPFVIYGLNPTIAFVGSGVMARCIYSIFKVNWDGQPISLQAGIYRALFASWLAPIKASLAFAVTFVAFWFVILYVLHKRNIVLKV
jgi:predicted acyltransferase